MTEVTTARDSSPAALEEQSWEAWWQDDGAACMAARRRAYRGYRAVDDPRGAARMAIWLADDRLEFGGKETLANDWLGRATRLLERLDPCPEHSLLAAFSGRAMVEAGELETARRLSVQACELGHHLGIYDLEMFGLASEGLAMVGAGAVEDGMSRLDEAAAAAINGEFDQLVLAARTCCLLIDACERLRDYDCSGRWCFQVEEFARERGIGFLQGKFQSHLAAVLGWRGDWAGCEREATAAIEHLGQARPSLRREALVPLAELRRGQGRFDEADELFEQAEPHELAALGRAALALETGEPATAHELLAVSLERLPEEARLARSRSLELIVHAEAALGRERPAGAHLEELRSIAADVPNQALGAALSSATGVLAAAAGRHDDARRAFAEAADRFDGAKSPWHAARARLGQAEALAELGELEAATDQANATLAAFEGLGAAADAARARDLLGRLGVG